MYAKRKDAQATRLGLAQTVFIILGAHSIGMRICLASLEHAFKQFEKIEEAEHVKCVKRRK